nr:glycosyltransferase [Microbacterium pseudoresistens]
MRDWITQHPAARDDFRASIGIPEDHSLAVAVGGLNRLKGHRFLLSAVMSMPKTSLVLVGDGPERDALHAQARNQGIADRVHLLGVQQDAWRWAAVADVVVQPSAHEGLPVTLMEAVALGTPVVATDVGGVGELIRDHPRAVLIASADPTEIATGLERALLLGGSAASGGLPARASEWSVSRFARDFYAALMP